MVKVHSGEDILLKASTPSVECTNVTDRQITDGFAIAKTRTCAQSLTSAQSLY